MVRPKLRLGFLLLAGVVLALAALAGCSSSPITRRDEARLAPARQGAVAAVVFADPTDPSLGEVGAEEYRSDARLSPGFPAAMMATDQWPEAARPDPRYARSVLINQRPEAFIYFERRGSWSSHERGGHSRWHGDVHRSWRYKPGW